MKTKKTTEPAPTAEPTTRIASTDLFVLTIVSDMGREQLGPPMTYTETEANVAKIFAMGGWKVREKETKVDSFFPIHRLLYVTITPADAK